MAGTKDVVSVLRDSPGRRTLGRHARRLFLNAVVAMSAIMRFAPPAGPTSGHVLESILLNRARRRSVELALHSMESWLEDEPSLTRRAAAKPSYRLSSSASFEASSHPTRAGAAPSPEREHDAPGRAVSDPGGERDAS
jgi:hypothetical protein